mmetsp:Transcript_29928/g.72541  ORF Transcript_29928/g.72541 Transcript_29928/m.72541 type:complete len:166 (-) Transcript_29928:850-1347(-)
MTEHHGETTTTASPSSSSSHTTTTLLLRGLSSEPQRRVWYWSYTSTVLPRSSSSTSSNNVLPTSQRYLPMNLPAAATTTTDCQEAFGVTSRTKHFSRLLFYLPSHRVDSNPCLEIQRRGSPNVVETSAARADRIHAFTRYYGQKVAAIKLNTLNEENDIPTRYYR